MVSNNLSERNRAQNWVAVKEVKLSYCIEESQLINC